jgi:hypothetical protein
MKRLILKDDRVHLYAKESRMKNTLFIRLVVVFAVVFAISLVSSNSATAQVAECQPAQGTSGTEVDITNVSLWEEGRKLLKPKVLIGETKCKPLSWGATFVRCLLKEVKSTMGPGTYDVAIRPKGKGLEPIVIPNAFTIMAPSINTINPVSGPPKAQVTIRGSFFGTKKIKVYMDDGIRKKPKRCKVTFLTMDSETGESVWFHGCGYRNR